MLLKLAETEQGHAERWTAQLRKLGGKVPPARDTLRERVWRWVLVQSGTDNALRHIESNEVDDAEMYKALADVAPTEADRAVVQAVLRDEEVHGGAMQRMGEPPPIDP